MNLYEIDSAIMALVDPETGEIQDWDAFEALQMARDQKIENVACWYKNLITEATAIKAEEDVLKKRREKLETQAKRKLEYLQNALCGQKFATARCEISFRKTTKVVLEDERAAIDWAQSHGRDDLLRYTAPAVNKAEMAKVLKEQVEIPGAALVEGLSMGVK